MNRGLRTLLLVAASVVVFAGAYFAASVLLPDPPMAMDEGGVAGTLTLPEATIAGEGVGPSEGMSFRVFDPQTNLPVAQVRIGTYRRTGERTVELKDVTVSVAVQGGAAAVLTSQGGTMRVEPPVSGGERAIDADALAAADQIRLSDVTIRWYENVADLAQGRGATTTAKLDNVLLDYTRMTLATADTTINGRTVLGDDVPVRVRGSDYDFDGYGLLVEWNANAKRPDLVRVARGERLVVKKAPALFGSEATARANDGGILLAAADNSAVAEAVANAPVNAVAFTPYRVTLMNNLTVAQSGLTMLEADEATAIVALASESVSNLRAAPAERVAPEQPKHAAPDGTPPTKPAAQALEPILVRWSGPLIMKPAAPDAPALADADDVRLSATGTPLLARFEGGEIRGASVDYHRADDRLELLAAAGEMVTLNDTEGNLVVAPSLVAAPDAGTATAVGAGRAVLAATAEGGTTTLQWQRLCNFAFERTPAEADGEETFALREVDAQGAVTVRSDELNLSAETLGLGFASVSGAGAAKTPQLRSVAASGEVDCTLRGSEAASFTAGRMWLDLPDGPDGPVDAKADGGVRTKRDDQTLSGQSLAAELRPDGSGELALARLEVTGDVVAQDADGRTLTGHIATIEGPDRPLVVVGGDDRLARVNVTSNDSVATVKATTVVLDPTDESFAVPTAGELFVEQIDESGDRQSRTVKWTGGLAATDVRVDVTGNVELRGDPDEPATFLLTSDTATLLLKATDAAASDAKETTATLAGDVEQVEVRGNVRLTGEERNAAGELLRSVDLRAPVATGRPQDESFNVPAAGRFLYRDLRAKEDAAADEEGSFGGFRGLAACAWKDRLDYRPQAEALTLTGGATASLEPDGAPPFQVTADTFLVQVTRDDADTPPQLTGAVAVGNVEFTSPGRQSFTAERLVYDESAGTLTATGAGGGVRLFDEAGRPTGQFAELVYNVRTGQIDRVIGLRGG